MGVKWLALILGLGLHNGCLAACIDTRFRYTLGCTKKIDFLKMPGALIFSGDPS